MKKQSLIFRNTIVVFLILGMASACRKDTDGQSGMLPSGAKDELSSGPDLKSFKSASKLTTDTLVFDDEFNGTALDLSKWSIVQGNENVNQELQTYAASAITAGGGVIKIAANLQSGNGRAFTSGKITTKSKFQVKYGRIEASMRLPMLNGLAPSFQLTGTTASPNLASEIDMVQHANRETKVSGGIRWDNAGAANFINSSNLADPGNFHTYVVDWDDKQIVWYIDGIQYATANIENNINSTEEFHQPLFIDLKLAVGGFLTGGLPVGTLPATITIDYVRVYKKTIPVALP